MSFLRACIAKEIDMIEVRRTAEHDSFIFEAVARKGKGETRHHVTKSREMAPIPLFLGRRSFRVSTS